MRVINFFVNNLITTLDTMLLISLLIRFTSSAQLRDEHGEQSSSTSKFGACEEISFLTKIGYCTNLLTPSRHEPLMKCNPLLKTMLLVFITLWKSKGGTRRSNTWQFSFMRTPNSCASRFTYRTNLKDTSTMMKT
jgi:hypothetical protein